MKHKNGIMEQTYWNDMIKSIGSNYNQFLKYVGDETALSRVFLRKIILSKCYKSVLDVGCGTAIDYRPLVNEGIEYTGVESCEFFIENNNKQHIPMIKCHAHSIPLKDSSVELVFGRHILEHQPYFAPVMNEMIRVALKSVAHIFFMKPNKNGNNIYNEQINLYHNTYIKEEINTFLKNHPKVISYEWSDIENTQENLLFVELR